MSWQLILGRPEPVAGDPELFRRTERIWRDSASQALELGLEFSRILDRTQDTNLRGHAADAFRSIVRETKLELDDVPRVCRDIEGVLSQHAARLAEFRGEAARALARAQTAWGDANRHARERDAASARVSSVQAQIRSLQRYPPEQVESSMRALRENESAEIRQHRRAVANFDGAQQRLRTADSDWAQLHESERQLNQRTGSALAGVELRGLRDPGTIERLLHSGVDWVHDAFENLGGILLALVTGDVEQLLWRLRDLLDDVSVLLTIAMVVVVAVIAVGALLCPPLALAGVAWLAALVKAQAVVSLAKVATTTVLWSRQSIDPKTGRQLGLVDVGLDTLTAGLAVVGAAKLAGPVRMVMLQNGTRLGQLVARRIAWKSTLGFGRDVAMEVGGNVGQSGIQTAVSDSDGWAFTVGSEDRRDVIIHRQLTQVRARGRGLSTGCKVRLVPCGAR